MIFSVGHRTGESTSDSDAADSDVSMKEEASDRASCHMSFSDSLVPLSSRFNRRAAVVFALLAGVARGAVVLPDLPDFRGVEVCPSNVAKSFRAARELTVGKMRTLRVAGSFVVVGA